jgi:DNA-binding response OmpR family regulator
MMGDADTLRFMLRAELRCSGETLIASGFELTDRTIFVVTDWNAPPGTELSIRLSFPTLIEPVELAARVAANRASGSPGEPGGLELAFANGSREVAAALVSKVRQLCASASVSANARARPAEAAFRVLLVEDNRLIRDMFAFGMTRSCQPPGAVAIDHAETAERAWSKLTEAHYDLIIVDYFLPTEDGASLIARLRQDDRLSQVPVVAISVGGPTARDATLSAGADLFLDKPLVLRDLLHTVKILARHDRSGVKRRGVLVLDDSPLVLAVTRFALESAGFEVAIAEDLATFERLRKTFSPDLMLIDVQMPEAFGDDIASTLRGWQGVRVPIVLVSSLEETELARRARAAQVEGYVLKEAGMTALVDRCREILERAA